MISARSIRPWSGDGILSNQKQGKVSDNFLPNFYGRGLEVELRIVTVVIERFALCANHFPLDQCSL